MRPILAVCGLVVVASLLLLPASPVRGADADTIAAGLDANVAEVASAGSWEADGRKGSYRAIVVYVSTAGKRAAKIYVQWLSPKSDGTGTDIIMAKPVQALNDINIDNAALELESEAANEATLLVQSYDPARDTDLSKTVKLGLPGQMTVEDPAPVQ